MKHTIPFLYGIEKNGEPIHEGTFYVDFPQSKVNEIINFISENEYLDCELCNMPGKYFDETIENIRYEVSRYLRKNKISAEGVTFGAQPFLPVELIELFPDDLKERLNTKEIFEWYDVSSMEELLQCKEPPKDEPEKKVYQEGTYMKTLAIRQPYAHLIAMGIKDVECRDAMPTKCRKIFVAASSSKVPWKELPPFVQNLVEELEAEGKMPPYKKLPTKCIIGIVDIVHVGTEPVESIWGRDWPAMKYTLKNAEMLDEPIYGLNKATPYFYNVEGYNEQNLPASHKVDLTGIELPK